MALIKLGGGITDIRGKMGGNVFSRNKGGNYIRANVRPCNPRSPLQNQRRAHMAHLTKYWSNTLTPQERVDWIAYAAGTAWTNKLGEAITINGMAAFLRVNAVLGILDPTVHSAAPTATGHAGGVTFTFVAESDTTKIQVDEPTGAFSKDITDHRLLLFQGLPTEIGRIATPKGFRYIGLVAGNETTPPTFPLELTSAYTMTAGQFITIKAMFVDEDYRVSGPFFAHGQAALAVI